MGTCAKWLFGTVIATMLSVNAIGSVPAFASERRVVLTEDADYFGQDYDIVQDVELDACKSTCLGDDQCRAFTYNVSASWCFLKSGTGELRSVTGAISGRVVEAAEPRPDFRAKRISELGFLPQAYLDEARRLAGDVSRAPLRPGTTADSAILAAGTAMDPLAAANHLRAALRLDPERMDLWLRFAEAVLNARSSSWDGEKRLAEERVAGAVNAYLSASTEEERATALATLGAALASREAWKPAIKAYRASLALLPNFRIEATLDRLVAEHGFRIVEHAIDSDAAAPRICLVFSEPLARTRGDLAPFIRVEGENDLPIETEGNQICVDGVEHGRRYRITARAGLPSSDGEVLAKSATLDLYVRDRSPSVRFENHAYVLPAGGEASVPIVSVNADRLTAELVRVGDRQLARAIGDGKFLSQLSGYDTEEISTRTGEAVWKGEIDVVREVNRETTTAIPIGELVEDLQPGAYALSARPLNAAAEDWAPRATQWFIITDLGLTTLAAQDGLHVFVRSLSNADPERGVALRLVALNNEVLGRAETDAQGYARFAPGLLRGTGGSAPALIAAEMGSDYAFLDFTKAPFDLTDRGVDGRPPAGPLDVFLTTERGIYRVGETVHVTGLTRNAKAEAASSIPLTAIITRPDGVEHARFQLSDQGLGSVYAAVALPENAMRGPWRAGLYMDPKDKPLASTSFLVEDFQPERLDFDLKTEAAALDPAALPPFTLAARFLYGAPAAGLDIEGETVIEAADGLERYPGYRFGLADETFETMRQPLNTAETDDTGAAQLGIALPDAPPTSRPLQAAVNVRVIDTSGRPVERSVTLPVLPDSPRIGIKPLFDGAVDENGTARFDVIAVDEKGERMAANNLTWTLNKVETRFQWYQADGRWNYETISSKRRVADGPINVPADAPGRVEAQVLWGGYELEVREASSPILPASVAFEAGWYVAPKALETPDILKVSLDKPRYRIGETAVVHIEPRFAGEAQVLILDDRLVAAHSVTVPEGGAEVSIPVTREWGPGAYVTAVLYRPMDLLAKRMPGRAIGLQWAGVDPQDRLLEVAIDAPQEIRPRRPLSVGLDLPNLQPGAEAYVTIAAVDLGILNLTEFEVPKPEAWYFGQRRLGTDIRDVYSQLIDRMQGTRGRVRSGGDAPLSRFEGPPPAEDLVALHSGIVRIGVDGRAEVTFDLPDFNGTLRLMAMAWSADGVGSASEDILVRDPVVLSAALPAYLAPGDSSRIAIDLAHTSGPTGATILSVVSSDGHVRVEGPGLTRISLDGGEREQVLVPVTAATPGDDVIRLFLTLPGGETIEKTVTLPVRVNEPEVARRSFVTLSPEGALTLEPDAFSGLLPGTATATLSATGAGRLDVAGILRALDRYPYGCTEQITSRALPLVYLSETALAAGLTGDPAVKRRVEEAIAGILANQASNGAFGLWGPSADDLWLDGYVTDFLTRAKAAGFDVPESSFTLALDNLQNQLAYAPDFENGGEDIAYALYVLARNGRAAIGDLRYYAETRLDAFSTPLAKAQIAAALALSGDASRAEAVFRRAVASLPSEPSGARVWRADYGSTLRDAAAILTLASETRSDGVDLDGLASRVVAGRADSPFTSTQEDAWSLLAAHALMRGTTAPRLALDGRPIDGPLFAQFGAERMPIRVENRGEHAIEVAVTFTGVPARPEPAGGNGYEITRAYYTLDGELADPGMLAQGDRLVAILTITAKERGPARLVINDPLPGGFEIDSPTLLRGGDVSSLGWLDPLAEVAHAEFRADRFVAAVNREAADGAQFKLAYVVRATSPGSFAHPAAVVEDMYRPEHRARTGSERVEVVGPRR